MRVLLVQLFVVVFSASSNIEEMFKNPVGFVLVLVVRSVVPSRAEEGAGGALQGERDVPGFIHWYFPNVILMSFLPVFAGRAEHVLPEVCAVDAPRTLLGAATPRVFCQRGRSGHEGDLRLHGRPVSPTSLSFPCRAPRALF